jgi:hypothetical protein
LRQASLSIGDAQEFKRLPDEIEPRADLKRNARRFPEVDRSNQGDPLAGLRPTRFSSPRQFPRRRSDFHHDETQPAGAFAVPDDEPSSPGSVAAFEPWPLANSPVTAHSSAEASPAGTGPRSRCGHRDQRAADARSDARDPPRDRARIGDARPGGFGTGRGRGSPRGASDARHGRDSRDGSAAAALIDQDKSARKNRCLAEAIYFEARGESGEGQAAVAQVA